MIHTTTSSQRTVARTVSNIASGRWLAGVALALPVLLGAQQAQAQQVVLRYSHFLPASFQVQQIAWHP